MSDDAFDDLPAPNPAFTPEVLARTIAAIQSEDGPLWERYRTRALKGLPPPKDMVIRLSLLIKVQNPAFGILDIADMLKHMRRLVTGELHPGTKGTA